jgi:hypothetical protein
MLWATRGTLPCTLLDNEVHLDLVFLASFAIFTVALIISRKNTLQVKK